MTSHVKRGKPKGWQKPSKRRWRRLANGKYDPRLKSIARPPLPNLQERYPQIFRECILQQASHTNFVTAFETQLRSLQNMLKQLELATIHLNQPTSTESYANQYHLNDLPNMLQAFGMPLIPPADPTESVYNPIQFNPILWSTAKALTFHRFALVQQTRDYQQEVELGQFSEALSPEQSKELDQLSEKIYSTLCVHRARAFEFRAADQHDNLEENQPNQVDESEEDSQDVVLFGGQDGSVGTNCRDRHRSMLSQLTNFEIKKEFVEGELEIFLDDNVVPIMQDDNHDDVLKESQIQSNVQQIASGSNLEFCLKRQRVGDSLDGLLDDSTLPATEENIPNHLQPIQGSGEKETVKGSPGPHDAADADDGHASTHEEAQSQMPQDNGISLAVAQNEDNDEDDRENLRCRECRKTFSCAFSLKRHNSTVHQGSNDHQCAFCNKCYSRKDALSRHIRNVHNNPMNYKCSFCEKSYDHMDTLNEHIKTKHTFNCPICRTFYNHKATLIRHNALAHCQKKKIKTRSANTIRTESWPILRWFSAN